MNTPTPTAVIIKEEFDSILDPYYIWLEAPRRRSDEFQIVILELNMAHAIIRNHQRTENQIFDTASQDINDEFVSKLPVSVRIDFARIYFGFSGIFHSVLPRKDIYRIVGRGELIDYDKNFKNDVITQSKLEAFLDTNVSAYLNHDVILFILQFLL